MLGALSICWQIVQPDVARAARKRRYHIQEMIREGRERANRQPRRSTSKSRTTRKPGREKVNPRLWSQLITLVQGDTAVAARLIRYEQNRNPDRSRDWCAEKAIWQLQRDRH
ncbi:hypothetical protein [Fortiea contorta]|uniref:hypothetical protein n=1 Tax=Fortiea contorta TaxID=1892405 RepID=UPI000346E0D8|nr:hypothetical protein [Fortiea contorta]